MAHDREKRFQTTQPPAHVSRGRSVPHDDTTEAQIVACDDGIHKGDWVRLTNDMRGKIIGPARANRWLVQLYEEQRPSGVVALLVEPS